MNRVIILRSNPILHDPRVQKEASSLIKRNYKTQVLCWDREKDYEINKNEYLLNNQKIPTINLGIHSNYGAGFKKNIKPLLKFQYKAYKYLKNNKNTYDVIHACDLNTGLVGYICSKIFHKKIVYDIFDYYVDSYSVPTCLKGIVDRIEKYIINHADHVIICTEKRYEQIGRVKTNKITVIHNAPQNSQKNYRKSVIKSSSNCIKIAYIGILQDGRFLKEMADVIALNENFELHIGGIGKYESYFLELSKKISNIYYYGKLSYQQTLKLEDECDIMTAIYDPSIRNHYFAAPNKFYEAMMLGKPVIMIENTGMSEVLKENKIGKVIPYNKEDLNKAFEELRVEKDSWSFKSKIMKEIYKKRYSWEIMEKRLIKIYKSLEK